LTVVIGILAFQLINAFTRLPVRHSLQQNKFTDIKCPKATTKDTEPKVFEFVDDNDDVDKLIPPVSPILGSPGDSKVISVADDPVQDSPEEMSLWTARVILIVTAALYGTNFGCVKILGQSLDPSVGALLRFTASGLTFAPWLIPNLQAKRNVVLGGLEVGIYTFIGYLAQAIALQTTPASTAAFICALVVVVVPLLDLIWEVYFAKEKFEEGSSSAKNPYFAIFPALVAAAGVGVLELGGSEMPGFGDLLAIVQPICFGTAFWRSEALTRDYPKDTAVFTGACMATIAFGSFIWTIFDHIVPMIPKGADYIWQDLQTIKGHLADPIILAAILWTGIVTTALTIYGENKAMVKVTAAESTIIFSTEPLWGTVFSAVTLGEQIGWNTILGAILILTSCLWSTLGPAVTAAGLLSTLQASAEMSEVLENLGVNFTAVLKKLADWSWFLDPT